MVKKTIFRQQTAFRDIDDAVDCPLPEDSKQRVNLYDASPIAQV